MEGDTAVPHLNDRAMRVADRIVASADDLAVTVSRVAGARVVDAGVEQRGCIAAGVLTARVCLADLGEVSIVPGRVAQTRIPAVAVHVSRVVAACMASQYAGWRISVGKYFAMASGPMRAAARKEALFEDIGCAEQPECAVGVLESADLPDATVIRHIADECRVEPDRLTLIVARTASIAGGTQIAARSVETAMHKLHELRFDLSRVVSGYGVAPLAPVAADDIAAIGRTNDAVLYGAEVTLYVDSDDETLRQIGEQLPSNTSKDYGEPFAAIFGRYDHDFYKIDPMLFSPAAVCLQNVRSGRVHRFGAVNDQVLARSFFGE